MSVAVGFLLMVLAVMVGIVAMACLLGAAFALLWRIGKARGWVE